MDDEAELTEISLATWLKMHVEIFNLRRQLVQAQEENAALRRQLAECQEQIANSIRIVERKRGELLISDDDAAAAAYHAMTGE